MNDSRLAALAASMPFTQLSGIELLDAADGAVTGRLAWDPARCTAAGVLHGGALMTLADTCGAVCAFLQLPDERHRTATTASTTHFLAAVRSGHVSATARPLHVGRQAIVVETELVDDGGRLVAKTTQTQAVLAPH